MGLAKVGLFRSDTSHLLGKTCVTGQITRLPCSLGMPSMLRMMLKNIFGSLEG